MAILGKLDAKAMGTAVAVLNGDATVTTAGDFTDASDNKINAGDILRLDGVDYIVKSVDSATSLELHTAYAGADATIAAGSAIRRTAPKEVAAYVVKGGDSNPGQLLQVNQEEAALDENRSRGINGPGWWIYKTQTDVGGNTRHKAECIASFAAVAATTLDDTDDALVADVTSTISISAQPADVGAAADPFTGTFVVAASASVGSLVFQWQRQTATGTRWVNITGSLDGGVYSGQTGSTLTVTGAAKADLDGYKFRVKLTSDAGAEEVISDAATLTYA